MCCGTLLPHAPRFLRGSKFRSKNRRVEFRVLTEEERRDRRQGHVSQSSHRRLPAVVSVGRLDAPSVTPGGGSSGEDASPPRTMQR